MRLTLNGQMQRDEQDIPKANLIESLQKQAEE